MAYPVFRGWVIRMLRCQHFAVSERVNARVAIDVRKDLAARLADAGADFLVVDSSSALLYHRGRWSLLCDRVPRAHRSHGHAVERR